MFIIVNEGSDERVTLAEGPTQVLRLDQIALVYNLGDEAQCGMVAPQAGLERLREILHSPARFGAVGIVGGHTILTTGLAMMLLPTWFNVATAAILGAIVGTVKMFNRNRPVLAVPLPVVATPIAVTALR